MPHIITQAQDPRAEATPTCTGPKIWAILVSFSTSVRGVIKKKDARQRFRNKTR